MFCEFENDKRKEDAWKKNKAVSASHGDDETSGRREDYSPVVVCIYDGGMLHNLNRPGSGVRAMELL